MSAKSKIITYNLQSRVLQLAGKGQTTDAIAGILTDEMGGKDTISQPTISRWLKAERKERSEQTRSIVQEHMKATVPKDLDALDEVLGFLLSHFRNVLPDSKDDTKTIPFAHDYKARAEYGMKAVKIVETKLRFAGVLEDPDKLPGGSDDISDEERQVLKDLATARAKDEIDKGRKDE